MALNLKQRGYDDVAALEGGFDAWQSAGYPVEPKEVTHGAHMGA